MYAQYCLPDIIQAIKSKRMRWVGHVQRIAERRGEVYTEFWWGNLGERDHLGDSGLEGRIILRCIFRK